MFLRVVSLLVLMALSISLTGQQFGAQTLQQLESSPAGSRIISFVDMINADTELTADDVAQILTPRLLEKFGADKLIGFLQEIRDVDGGVILYSMERKGMFAYNGVARGMGTGEWLNLGFTFENAAPYRIDGFTLEPGQESDASPMYPADVQMTGEVAMPDIAPQSEKEQSRFLQGRMEQLPGEVDAYVKTYTDLGIFSGVVLLADRGKVFYHKAFGMADRENQVLNSLTTTFNIGSMNKSFTAILIGQLVAEGIIDFDSKLTDILPGFGQTEADRITIEHLLRHTSGFGDYYSQEFFEAKGLEDDQARLLEYIRTLPLQFTPGDDQMYSNAGYVILGGIIQELTGVSYAENVKQRILDPLKLVDTHVENVRNAPNRSIGYMQSATGAVIDNLPWFHEPNPSGGFWATTEDVLKFYQSFFYDEKLLPHDSKMNMPLFRMIAPYFNDDRAAIPLAGGSNGLNTVICEMLGERISIIVFANMDEPVAEHVGSGILDIVRGDEPELPSLPAHMNVYKSYKDQGLSYVRDNFEDLTMNFHPSDPKDLILNRAGYDLMSEEKYEDAIALLKLNAEMFPDVANCYDSLGEAYHRWGDNASALEWYRRALEINPGLQSALEMVKKLK